MSGNHGDAPDVDLLKQLVDEDRLAAWLRAEIGELSEPLELERISTGHTNEIIRLRAGDLDWVLRRPPRHTVAPNPKGMAREFRVLRALDQTDVPHPRTVAICEDPEVIGAPFYIMEHVDGIGAGLPLPAPFDGNPAGYTEMAHSLVDTLARIAQVDWREVGLEGFGKPEGFLERQVGRWKSHLEQYRTRDLPGLDDVADWLEKNQPDSSTIGIIHGDYQWNNVMFARDRPGRVVAVVDWEQSTVGDPLLDLGWLLGLWYEVDEEAVGRSADRLFCKLPDMPTRADLAERYATATGLSLDHLDYYCTLAMFKLAIVIEGSYARYVAGKSDDPLHATFEVRVPALIERAAAFMRGEL